MNICKGKTKDNKRCKRKCKNKYCFNHSKKQKGGQQQKYICKDHGKKYADYKQACGNLRNERCSMGFTEKENRDWQKKAINCYKKRNNFTSNCVAAKDWDSAHFHEIKSLVEKKDLCDSVIRAKRAKFMEQKPKLNKNMKAKIQTMKKQSGKKQTPKSKPKQQHSWGKKVGGGKKKRKSKK